MLSYRCPVPLCAGVNREAIEHLQRFSKGFKAIDHTIVCHVLCWPWLFFEGATDGWRLNFYDVSGA